MLLSILKSGFALRICHLTPAVVNAIPVVRPHEHAPFFGRDPVRLSCVGVKLSLEFRLQPVYMSISLPISA